MFHLFIFVFTFLTTCLFVPSMSVCLFIAFNILSVAYLLVWFVGCLFGWLLMEI